jgi:tRNA(Ile)-lysidine synthetase-like protein
MANTALHAALAQSPIWDGLAGGVCVVACSGGRDSVALACAVSDLLGDPEFNQRFSEPPQLTLWHLDHGLRPESAADAAFVEQLADKLDAPCIVERAQLDQTEGNLEAAARQERYLRLMRLLVAPLPSDGLPTTRRALTAHHLGDQVETVLHHLVRGTHVRGLRAISPIYQQLVFRPWLEEPPESITDYLVARGQAWREDATNTDTAYTRNRLRHNVVPELQQINPRAREHIARLATIAQDMQAIVDTQLQALPVQSLPALGLMPWLPLLAAPCGRYFAHYLAEGWLHPTLLAEFAARQLAERVPVLSMEDYGEIAEWSNTPAASLVLHGVRLRVHQQRVLTLAFPCEPRNYSVNVGLILNQTLRQGRLWITVSQTDAACWQGYLQAARLPWEFIRDWPDFLNTRAGQANHGATWSCFLPASAQLPLYLRNWRAGDVINLPSGGTKKLGDVFTDAKVPENFRSCWAVLLDAYGQILWVPGLADSAQMQVHPGEQPAYCVQLSAAE